MVRKPSGKNSKRKGGDAENLPPLSGELMNMLMAQLAASRTSEAVDEAQDIMFEAWEAEDPKTRIALARKALTVCPDCADAYVLLAMDQKLTRPEVVALYAEGVAAGERALGAEAFEQDVGDFWGLLETRPYMRARLGLATALWEIGRGSEAIAHATEMLRLNPDDNQGVRYLLVNWLLSFGRIDEADALLVEYKDDASAVWAWSGALVAFQRGGDGMESRKAIARARKANAHVAAYLTGRKKIPKALPAYYGDGDENEAALYAADAAGIWNAVPGAVAWLAAPVRKDPRT